MTLETTVTLLFFSLFALCTAALLARTLSAHRFRRTVALPRGFTEGIAAGAAYPIWLIVYAAVFLQCAAYIAFPSSRELDINFRLIAYLGTVILFFAVRCFNLPLLSVWFGNTGIWVCRGASGLISYDAIDTVSISCPGPKTDGTDAICTVVFYASDRKLFFHPRRYACKLSAYELSKYRSLLPEPQADAKKKPSRGGFRLAGALSYVSLLLTVLGAFSLLFSTELFSPYRYDEYAAASSEEIVTSAPVTEVISEGGTVIVRYKAIEAINVYSEADGIFLWSVSRDRAVYTGASDGLWAKDGSVKYTVAGSTRYFDCLTGQEQTADDISGIEFPDIGGTYAESLDFTPLSVSRRLSDGSDAQLISRPLSYLFFVPAAAWALFALGLVTLYIWRMLDGSPRAPFLPEKRRASDART